MENIPPNEQQKNNEISKELIVMFEKDQAMRQRAIDNDGVIESDGDANLDKINANRLKEIIQQHGWPTVSRVGKEASRAAFFLVQHADHDLEFQKDCLALMKAESEEEVRGVDIAYLTDRILVNEGNPQIYGTQFWEKDGVYGPRPIENPDHVDERRKELGMMPMAEYEKILREKYKLD